MKDEMKKRLRDDFGGYIERLRDDMRELNSGHRKKIYAVGEQSAAAILHLMNDNAAFRDFLKDAYFKKSRKKIANPGIAVFRYIEDATSKNAREQCSRIGRAVEKLLSEGVAPDQIANQLSEQGGIMAVIDQLVSNKLSKQADVSIASSLAQVDDDEDDKVEDDEVEDEDDADEQGSSEDDNATGKARGQAKKVVSEPSRRSGVKLAVPKLLAEWAWFYLQVRKKDMLSFIQPGSHTAGFEVRAGSDFQVAVAVSIDDKDLDDDQDEADENDK